MDVERGSAPVLEGGPLKFKTGVIVAALIAAWLGLFALAISNIGADANAGFRSAITLNQGIGPYSGKEVFWLVTWLVSWPLLHFSWRTVDFNLRKTFGVFLVLLFIAVMLMWPPIFRALANAI